MNNLKAAALVFVFAIVVLYVVNQWLSSSATPEPTIRNGPSTLFLDIEDEDSTNEILRIRDGHDHVLLVVEAIDDNGVVTLRLNCPEVIAMQEDASASAQEAR